MGMKRTLAFLVLLGCFGVLFAMTAVKLGVLVSLAVWGFSIALTAAIVWSMKALIDG